MKKKYRHLKHKMLLPLGIIGGWVTILLTIVMILDFSWWFLLMPFAYMFFILYYCEKKGYMRQIRSQKEIKFHNEHTYLYSMNFYRDDPEKYYKNNNTGEIVIRD